MSLRDFNEEIRNQKRKLYAAICIYQRPGSGTASPVNGMLEKTIAGLKSELPDYEEIQLAYVYETKGLQGCIPFRPVHADTEPFCMEPLDNADNHSIDHVYFMGMAMLEQMNSIAAGECRLYLITDDKLPRVNELSNPRFAGLNAGIIIQND